MIDDSAELAPDPGLKWHIDGRYLTREERLAQAAEETKLRTIGLWLCVAAAGLSAPFISKLDNTPSWLKSLLQDGNGASAFTLGCFSLAFSLFLYLRWRANRLGTPASQRLVDTFIAAADVIMSLGGIAVVAGLAAFVLGFIVPLLLGRLLGPWLLSVSPVISPYLQVLDHEPGPFWLAGGVALIMGIAVALTFRSIRTRSPDAGFRTVLSQALWTGLEPIGLVSVIVLAAFVLFGLFLSPVGEWLPSIKANERGILGVAVVASVMAIPAIYTLRRVGRLGSDDKPSLVGAAWTVYWILASFSLAMMAILLIVVVWHTASGYWGAMANRKAKLSVASPGWFIDDM
jgi:hypothetical protein